ncbi:hypothetical protein WMO40_09610 [Bacillaceae bacterium CLA-AA-H227]|uniref:Uncharacterized protein n=1 Tax=Robertmurraya yapensis (ex Hitch et al 2024) TaxID=3133160 RepID=A0ACC6SAM8_9BACI
MSDIKNDYGLTLRICAVVFIIILGITSPLWSKAVLNIDLESKSFTELVVIFTSMAIVIFFIVGRPIHQITNVLKK